MRHLERGRYALDAKHGLGILNGSTASSSLCFFENNSLEPVDKAAVDRDSAIKCLLEVDDRYCSEKEKQLAKVMAEQGTCEFLPDKTEDMKAVLTYDAKRFTINVARGRYYLEATCSCKQTRCAHVRAAKRILSDRVQKLKHAYIVTDLPVDKALFLEPVLHDAILLLREDKLDTALIAEIRHILHMVADARSDDYYRLFNSCLLDIETYDYDACFMEDTYGYLLTALFDTPDYRRTILDTGVYADADLYETRQHRSNRASFKRVLKSYDANIKELSRGDYQEDSYKEFLLKYRNDNVGLLWYYAEGKKTLELYDLPFLTTIASLPELDEEALCAAAAKLDLLSHVEEAVKVFHLLVKRIPSDRIADFYGSLHNIELSMEEMKTLPMEDQRKLVNRIPVSEENFRYVMDKVLCDEEPRAKGAFLLHTLLQLGSAGKKNLKRTLVQEAAGLPDNRLLLSYIRECLTLTGDNPEAKGVPDSSAANAKSGQADPGSEGDPVRELITYFEGTYKIINENSSFYCLFRICDPETGMPLLCVKEEGDTLRLVDQMYYSLPAYSPELIRTACLAGREEAYQAEYEKTQDAVSTYLFETKHKRFASEYRSLCQSFDDGKLLAATTQKAELEWLVYAEETTYAIAFKVGRTRKYVVKDAADFLDAFKTGQTIGYGKDLILTHDPDNMIASDAAALRLLVNARYKKGRTSGQASAQINKRYISINKDLMGNLLALLKGRTIFYDDVPCLIRLEPQKIRLKVSGKYVLSTNIVRSQQELINLLGRGFLLTRQPGGTYVLDRVEGTNDEINLFDLAYRNPSVNIKPILKDFQKNVYARFFESIDVDKSVQPAFAQSQLRLNTYFDFDKSVITTRTVLLRNGNEIPVESLTNRIDLVKLELLEKYLTALGFVDGVLSDDAKVLAFFKMDFTRLKKLTNVYLSESLQNKELKSVGKPVIRVAYQNDLVKVFLEKSEYSEAELEKIITGIRRNKKYIMLSGNRLVDLDNEAARDLGEAVQDFGMNPKTLYKEKTVSFITAIKAFSHQKSCRVDKYLRDMIEEIRSFKEADLTAPKLNGTLREYQEEGFKWMSILAKYGMGGILADDMGLGKTIQVIALIKSDQSLKPSLVVCPKSLVLNWLSEFAKFDGTTEVTAIYGPEGKRSELIAAIDYNKKGVYITSYDSLRNDIEKYSGEFNYGILDEAQYIKNIHAKKTQSVKELKVCHRFALTGTPIENSVIDLWSIFDYTMPGYFEELTRFRDSATEAIARKSAPFILRRVKEDVLDDLPSKYERILSAEMSTGQRKVYEAMRLEARKALEEGGKAFDILPYLMRLRQVCVDPGLFVEGYKGGSGKMDMLAELIPEYLENNHRILIFSQFVKALEAVRAMLTRKKIPTYFLSGSTSAKDRLDMMDSFNNGSGTDVFLISLKAGGTGLNLTGADTVIHLDPWWNVAAENQASDRTHRIGQTRNVEVIKLIVSDSIEQRVVELQDIKKEVIKQVISDDDGSVTSARLEDIAFVLQ